MFVEETFERMWDRVYFTRFGALQHTGFLWLFVYFTDILLPSSSAMSVFHETSLRLLSFCLLTMEHPSKADVQLDLFFFYCYYV